MMRIAKEASMSDPRLVNSGGHHRRSKRVREAATLSASLSTASPEAASTFAETPMKLSPLVPPQNSTRGKSCDSLELFNDAHVLIELFGDGPDENKTWIRLRRSTKPPFDFDYINGLSEAIVSKCILPETRSMSALHRIEGGLCDEARKRELRYEWEGNGFLIHPRCGSKWSLEELYDIKNAARDAFNERLNNEARVRARLVLE